MSDLRTHGRRGASVLAGALLLVWAAPVEASHSLGHGPTVRVGSAAGPSSGEEGRANISVAHHPPVRARAAEPPPSVAQGGSRAEPAPPPSSDTVSGSGGWNSSRTLELVERGRRSRAEVQGNADLESYRALTTGHIYFYVEPEDRSIEPALIRVDQVAVELYWRAPDLRRQVVVGHREEKRLPIRDFHYYLDRLSLVQYGFEDVIEVGHGRDVAGVPHPLAVEVSPEFPDPVYDYRLSDSVLVRLPGRTEPVQLYEVEVRPTDPSLPGFVGSIHLDRATGAITRMDFTFTPASYQDPRNDRVRVSLDYGLWEGRYWLPHEQRIEVRRELPQLDLGAGSVIQTVLRVGDYELNAPVDHVFPEDRVPSPVTFAPLGDRRTYHFSEGLMERLADEGLQDALALPDPAEIRRLAHRAVRDQAMSGLRPGRIYLPGASSALRYNRAEGWLLGMGGVVTPAPRLRARGWGGHAFGARKPTARGELQLVMGDRWDLEVDGAWRELHDLGVAPGQAGLPNTILAVLAGRDDLDPFHRDRLGVGARLHLERGEARFGVGIRRDRSASLVRTSAPADSDRSFRPLRPVDEGSAVVLAGEIAAARPLAGPWRLRGRLDAEAGAVEGEAFFRPTTELSLRRDLGDFRGDVSLGLRAGTNAGSVPAQHHFLLGGRGTLPGYRYRGMAGRHFALVDGSLSSDLRGSLLRGHLMGSVGWTGSPAARLAEEWEVAPSDGLRPRAGAGVGIYHDLLRVDLSRGLRGGHWELEIYLDRRWWDRL